jgi:LPXTG-motif cell wall-anchored protein
MMWDRVSGKEGEYKEGEYKASDSGKVEMLPIYKNHDWQIKLLIDKAHPDNPDQDYYYFVQEFVVKDALTDEKVEKTDLVFYSSSYFENKTSENENKTSENWKEVYAIGNADKDPTFTLTITNELGDNVLPSTGGVGDIPYMATGLGTAVAGLFGAGVYSRKKKKDDEE